MEFTRENLLTHRQYGEEVTYMTISQLSRQLHSLSVGGYFNGERFSERRLETYISSLLRTGHRLVMEISLPDGRWFFTITRFSSNPDGFGYYIPESRDAEKAIIALLH